MSLTLDEYNQIEITRETAECIAGHLYEYGSFYGPFSLNNGTSLHICITDLITSIPASPKLIFGFGGNPGGCWLVSVWGKGAMHFSKNNTDFYPSYIAEKLNLSISDAEPVAKLLNLVNQVNQERK